MGFVEVVGRRRGRVRNGVCGGSGKEKREGKEWGLWRLWEGEEGG